MSSPQQCIESYDFVGQFKVIELFESVGGTKVFSMQVWYRLRYMSGS